MKSKGYIKNILVIAGCCLWMLAGCQQGAKRSLTAKYIVPPNVVSDVSLLQNLSIASPVVKLTGQYIKNQAKLVSVFSNCLDQRLSAGIYKEQFFNVQDDIHDNRKGLQSLNRAFAHAHGYTIKPARIIRRAEIRTRSNIVLSRTTGKDKVVVSLVSLPYEIKYTDEGIPYSIPDYTAQSVREHVSHVPFTHITAKGDLTVQVYDTAGKKVYEKRFKNLSYDKKVGGNSQADALPTVLEIASSLFDASIRTVVRDISPHKVERELFVNESGDTTAVVLLKATAFSEAYKRLSEITERNQKEYTGEATAIKKKFAAKIQDVKDSGKSAEEIHAAVEALQQEQHADLVETGRFRSPDYENMAIACEAMGIIDEALDFYTLSSRADPDNAATGAALARVKTLADKALNSLGEVKSTYEEEENKER